MEFYFYIVVLVSYVVVSILRKGMIMNKQGVLLIISGPSGSGKGTVVEELCKKDDYALSISATTRPPREYEENGTHYFFHSQEEFQQMKDHNELLEWAEFCGNFYGTPKKYVLEQIKKGKNVILEIEVQGALQVKEIYHEGVLVFLTSPSLEELASRLTNRGTETKDTINRRIKRAIEEIELANQYDYIVINEDVDESVNDIASIINAEKMRYHRNADIKKIFKGEI